MNVLVTGGAGYIGSTLTSTLLAEGHKVRVIDNLMYGGRSLLGFWSHPNFEFVRADIRETNHLGDSLEAVDVVVHLAAIVGDPACAKKPELAREVNFAASIALFDLCYRRNVRRFIFASTCSNYGKMKDPALYADESSELAPVSLYAETKVDVEKHILEARATRQFSPTLLRFATVFGTSPRMRFDLTVNEFTLELLTKKQLTVFGEQFWRPYVHVRDIARAISLVINSPEEKVAGRVFNVGSTEMNYQKQQLVEMILPLVPGAEISYVRRQEDPRDYRVSFERIKNELGYQTAYSVQQGIQEIAKLVSDNVLMDYRSPEFRN